MPKVSIIIPVYNAEKYLPRCVDSILNQEFEDFELLLVNDGSRDGSRDIIDAYAEKDRRVKAVHKENSGVSDTRNTGIAMAAGDYIQFLDADDWISYEATKLLYRTATEKDADLVIADFYRVVGERISPKGDIDTDEVMDVQTFGDYLMENPADFYYGVVWNKLYRTSIIREFDVKMDRDVDFCEDFIFNLEYILHCKRIAALQVPIYYYVKTEGSLVTKSMNLKKVAETKFNVIKYYDNFFKNIHTDEGYRSRRADILSYLVEFAKDDPASRLSPSTKKLGEESVPVYFPEGLENNIIANNYVENKLLERYMHAVALKTGLKDTDVSMLLLLSLAKKGVTSREAASYLGIPVSAATNTLQRLVRKKYVENTECYRLTVEAEPLKGELETVLKDFEDLKFRGFSPVNAETYRAFEKQAVENIRRVLTDPNEQ